MPATLRSDAKGCVVVCGGIHMSPIPSFSFNLHWGTTYHMSGNPDTRDSDEFLALVPRIPNRTDIKVFLQDHVNEALASQRAGRIRVREFLFHDNHM